ncbi:hypothetical protein DU478_16265 [Thalassococcus profundi]|uniref:Lipoprotein n=1 Tax=Thalassococcus profundi TaxID=2282382 RepID=A0A369TIN2_9RHOB|nr:hypothetical protein [Thalassococcus profundi]RDD65211.1 hypothetical protein DU478_16265 [Thalassococcus profundi]
MRLVILMTCLGLAAAGCSRDATRVAFDGVYYRANAKAARSDRKNFVATVRGVSRGIEGAKSAAEYEGIKHCIRFYGTSDIAWAVGPETPNTALPLNGDTLSFSGTCVE